MKLSLPLKNLNLNRYPTGQLFQGFGENPELYKPFGLAGHNGLDFVTHPLDEVLASHDGIVLEAHADATGYGNFVRLFNEDLKIFTIYGHLRSDLQVSVGQNVKTGQVLGYEWNSGFIVSGGTTYWGNAPAGHGVHLHFGLITNLVKGQVSNSRQFKINSKYFSCPANQGISGWVDPLPFLKNMKLYKNEYGELFLIANGKRYRIRTMDNLKDFQDLLETQENIKDIDLRKYPEGGIIG